MKKFKHYALYLAVSAVLLAVEIISISIIKADKKNYTVVIADVKHPGYEKIPGYAKVEASPAKIWYDVTHSNAKWLVILGLILALVPAAAAFKYDGEKGNTGSWVLWISAAASIFILLITYEAKYGSSSYQTNLCLDKYQQNINNLDSFFPSVDTGEFLKDCK